MLVICPHCKTRVMPMRDGCCPACRRDIASGQPRAPAKSSEFTTPAPEPPVAKKPHNPQRVCAVVAVVLGLVLFEVLVPYDAGERGFSFMRGLEGAMVGVISWAVGTAIGGAFGRRAQD